MEDEMKRIATAVLLIGFVICITCAVVTHAQSGGSITINKNGSPASGVSVVLELSNMGKAGNTGAVAGTTTGTTNSNGNPSNVLDLSNMGKAHYDVYEKECVNGETVVVIVPAGQTPKDDSCKKRRIGGFIWWNDGRDHVTIDTGTHTVISTHTSMGGGPSTGGGTYEGFKWELGGGFNYYHETNEPFYGGFGSLAYQPKPWIGFVGDFTIDHHSETDFSSTMEWYMFGVRVAHPTPHWTPCGQVLFGGIHSSFTSGTGSESTSGSANAFGMKVEGGIDYNVSPHFGVRLGQFGWDISHFGGGWQNNFDYSGGVVWHFGK